MKMSKTGSQIPRLHQVSHSSTTYTVGNFVGANGSIGIGFRKEITGMGAYLTRPNTTGANDNAPHEEFALAA